MRSRIVIAALASLGLALAGCSTGANSGSSSSGAVDVSAS